MSLKACLCGFTIVLSCFQAKAEEVRVYLWDEYLSNSVVAQFEAETGHKVVLNYFDNGQQRNDLITSGQASVYDLVLLDGYRLITYHSIGLTKSLNNELVPNRKHINKDALNSCGEGGIPYSWGTMGIGYRQNHFETPITSWKQLFKVSSEGSPITIPVDNVDTVATALLSLGFDPMTNNTDELKQAYSLLLEIKKHVFKFRHALSYAVEMKEKSIITAAAIYNDDLAHIIALTGQNDWKYVVPDEGTIIWNECFAAPSHKPIRKATLAFLNFINRPDIAAKNAEEIWMATSNESALKYTSSEYLNDTSLFPTNIVSKEYNYSALSLESRKMRVRIMSIIER